HLASFRVTVRARRAGGDANAPPREYFVCTTHRAILDALDRTVRADGGVPRLVSTQALDFGEG
ncbi:MAG TPA: hypothetical protein VMH78_06440, partial [Thermoplasmata archaeon]|nr:hypothetical protein [Thermoplasmata archaeon]